MWDKKLVKFVGINITNEKQAENLDNLNTLRDENELQKRKISQQEHKLKLAEETIKKFQDTLQKKEETIKNISTEQQLKKKEQTQIIQRKSKNDEKAIQSLTKNNETYQNTIKGLKQKIEHLQKTQNELVFSAETKVQQAKEKDITLKFENEKVISLEKKLIQKEESIKEKIDIIKQLSLDLSTNEQLLEEYKRFSEQKERNNAIRKSNIPTTQNFYNVKKKVGFDEKKASKEAQNLSFAQPPKLKDALPKMSKQMSFQTPKISNKKKLEDNDEVPYDV